MEQLTLAFHGTTDLSLEKGLFPKTEKEESVKPTLKSCQDHRIVESCSPISNLSFLGKVIETAAEKKFTKHVEKLNELPGDNSA